MKTLSVKQRGHSFYIIIYVEWRIIFDIYIARNIFVNLNKCVATKVFEDIYKVMFAIQTWREKIVD